MQKITPFLWYDGQAEEAAKLYVSLFNKSKIVSPAISMFVSCKTQKEVDALWEGLSAGGEQQPCGWLRDRFGVSWQIVPAVLGKLLQDKDPKKAKSTMQAMLQMKKLDIRRLKEAYDG